MICQLSARIPKSILGSLIQYTILGHVIPKLMRPRNITLVIHNAGPNIDSPERTHKSDMYSWATEYKPSKKSVLRSEEPVLATHSSISSDQHRTGASPVQSEGERSRGHAEEDKDGRKSGCGVSGGMSTEVQRHATVQGRTYETYRTVC